MENARTIIEKDLEYICRNLQEELPALAGKDLLITGGGGFLGYYLIQALLYWSRMAGAGCQITVYDNYIRGVPEWLQRVSGDRNLHLVKHDISGPLPEEVGDFQWIIHAASIASPTYYRKFPIETMDANVQGLRRLLEYCRSRQENGRPVEGFLFYSSSEVYGDPTPGNIPTPETYWGNVSFTGPRACYDESKRFGETLCVNYARQHRLPVKIARPFNNYGPGQRITDKRVIPDFARDVLSGRDIVMLSDGSPTRTFCYIADAIIGYYKVLVRGRAGEAYNIGVEAPEISIAGFAGKMVEQAHKLFGYSGRVVRQTSSDQNYMIDNPGRRCPRIEKAGRELGYAPSIGLEEGIRRSLVWYRENLEAEEGR